jgi:transposase-like protein
MSSTISAKHFHDEVAAFAFVESRVWPNGPTCPHCGGVDRIGKMKGKTTRLGLYKCYQCYKPFTVRIGTVFEASHVPLRYWLQAMAFMTASKKGISSNQLHRTLGVTLKTAWFMSHRIREAMRVVGVEPMGGAGKTVEIDETLIGRISGAPKHVGPGEHNSLRNTVLALVERGGSARTFHVGGTAMATLLPIIRANVTQKSSVMTDEFATYNKLGDDFARHASVNHSQDEYVALYQCGDVPKRQAVYHSYQHCRRLFLHLQAWHERRLPALQRETSAPLPCRIRFPLFQSH